MQAATHKNSVVAMTLDVTRENQKVNLLKQARDPSQRAQKVSCLSCPDLILLACLAEQRTAISNTSKLLLMFRLT